MIDDNHELVSILHSWGNFNLPQNVMFYIGTSKSFWEASLGAKMITGMLKFESIKLNESDVTFHIALYKISLLGKTVSVLPNFIESC